MRALLGDRGSVTAEFAVAVPAVLVILSLALGSILLATHRLTLTSAAAEVSRLEARGESQAAAERLAGLGARLQVERSRDGALHCVELRSSAEGGLLSLLGVTGRGCAAVSAVGGGQ